MTKYRIIKDLNNNRFYIQKLREKEMSIWEKSWEKIADFKLLEQAEMYLAKLKDESIKEKIEIVFKTEF